MTLTNLTSKMPPSNGPGANLLVVTTDTITIKSPGEPVPPITLKQLQEFNAPMLSRNPVLHYIFSRMELAEERGLGLKSIKARSLEAGLPTPKYIWENPYLNLTMYRSTAAAAALGRVLKEILNKSERAGWVWLASQGSAKSGDYARESCGEASCAVPTRRPIPI